MPRRRARVATATGLHARPASLVTRKAAEGGHPVLIGREGEPGVDASSILSVMGLRLQHGDQVELSSASDDAEALLDEFTLDRFHAIYDERIRPHVHDRW